MHLTCDLVDALSLFPIKQEDTFGANNSISQKLDVTSIRLKTRSGRYIPLSVLIVPSIAVYTINQYNQQRSSTIAILSWKLPLAHPLTADENFKISFLITVDH